VVHAFTATVDARRDQPLITYYDDATGERTELSGATLANWVAKTANLLVDGLGLGPGQVAAVRLPPHWQTAAVLLGCWAAGLTVDLTGDRRADVAFVGPPFLAPAADGSPFSAPEADEVYALALDPLGQPFRPGPPPGTADFIVEMRPHGDRLSFVATTPDQVALADGPRHAELVAQARRVGIPESARVLIDADAFPDPVVWLAAPLVVGTSVVACRHLDPTRLPGRLATERAVPFAPTA
jgi:TIGR03089 family protein